MQVKYRSFAFYRSLSAKILFASLFNLTGSFGLASAFVSAFSSYDSIITESSTILAKYFLFFTTTCNRIPNIFFFHIHDVFCIHIDIFRYSTIDLNCIFFHQIYIYIRIIYALLMFRLIYS